MDEPGLRTSRSFEGLLEPWHEHRAVILFATTCILVTTWLCIELRQNRKPPTNPLSLDPPFTKPITTENSRTPPEKIFPQYERAKGATTTGPRRIKGEPRGAERTRKGPEDSRQRPIQVLVFYSSLTGSTEGTANEFAQTLGASLGQPIDGSKSRFLRPLVLDLAQADYDEYFISAPKPADSGTQVDYFYLLLLPSYNIDTINDNFLEHLAETHHDFRIDTAPLSGILGYSVFGLGDREGWPTEGEGFCFQAKEVDKWMAKLTGRRRAYPLGMGDTKRDLKERLSEWADGVMDVLTHVARTGSLGEGVPGSGEAVESDDEYASGGDDDNDGDDGEVILDEPTTTSRAPRKKNNATSGDIEDVEDLGKIMKASQTSTEKPVSSTPIAVDFTTYNNKSASKRPPQTIKEMVPKNSPTYASLTKQGYTIVGSHSGVKICRWTKSALRGRGSCYKFSFYGIASHQCMETTPSLSCSNKCVFCWRHGTNPVGTNWRWVVDPPEAIFTGVKAGHYQKIKMMRGVPGVRAERFAEAMRIRHCALSLVGEPIFYPHINEFLALLHAERISSFLVCNAQHPDQLAALKAVTQLYVSIDASNRDSLRRIDRPLHRDFWERFLRCLDILRERRFRHRTVFRLTLVKGFNVEDEVAGYADLVARGLPCFVEVKGVTYCGSSSGSGGGGGGGGGLTMANVPFYAEVAAFVTALDRALRDRGLDYGIAAEHAHSCCVLLASGRFRVAGRWHTRIDYARFFELLEERGPNGEWTPEDYMGAETPEWATWGNGGFDPRDERVDRKGRKIET
ncbi:radical SAM superfamily-domain-containing protein [Durotheca rogersii]|uniref:radical SAM superfamily-domain-containing protein n=1 Tax=Durotheca rogersii TaxID=419775 RepID=UPI00221EE59D|nr:radical SAM superfamily-domain-containing protein [Durotheca rogersii]KAI5868425.1 radical SAM superfamily-domain-containing protein [Durotheca rogersii]